MPNALRLIWMSVCEEYVYVCVSNTSGCMCVLCLCTRKRCMCVCHIYRGHVHVCTREICMSNMGGRGGDVYKEGVYVKHWDGGRGLLTRHVCVSGTLEEMFMSVYKEDV